MEEIQYKVLQASLLVTLSAILYGFMGYLGTELLREHLPIPAMLFWRFFIAGAWMSLFLFKKGNGKIFRKSNVGVFFLIFFLGAFSYAGSSGFYFLSSEHIGTGLAMVLFFSYPIFVAITSMMFGGRVLSWGVFLTLIFILIGMALLQSSGGGHPIDFKGIIFGLLSALGYGFYIVFSKKFASLKLDTISITVTICFGCAFLLLILSLSHHAFAYPHTFGGWVDALVFGVLVTAVPVQLMLEGLKYISSLRASILSVLEPLITVFVGVLLLHEAISPLQMLGVFIILASALLIQLQKEL